MSGGDAKSRMARILRLHEEIDAIKDDIKEIYGEEKADGGDKTAMGAAISIIRKREKDATKFDDQQGMVDVYLTTFLGTGTVVATHTHASEPLPTKAAGQDDDAFAAVKGANARLANAAGVEPSSSYAQQASPKPASDLTSSQAPQGEVAPNSEAVTPVSNEQPEAHGSSPCIAAREADRPATYGQLVTRGESAATPSRAERIKALRPLCQRPEACGSSGGKKHCHSCVTAAESQEEHA